MSRAKSVFAGRSLWDPGMICSPALEREMKKAKSTGYLSGVAKVPNRWGIERVDVDANSCLQSLPCQHNAVLWLKNGRVKNAPSSCAADICAITRLIGVKFDKKGEEHIGRYADRFPQLRAEVEEELDKMFSVEAAATATTAPPAPRKSTEPVASTQPTLVAATTSSPASNITASEQPTVKKRSVQSAKKEPKKRLVETALGWVPEDES